MSGFAYGVTEIDDPCLVYEIHFQKYNNVIEASCCNSKMILKGVLKLHLNLLAPNVFYISININKMLTVVLYICTDLFAVLC